MKRALSLSLALLAANFTPTAMSQNLGQTLLITLPLNDVAPQARQNPTYREGVWRAPLFTRQLVRRIGKEYRLRAVDAWPIASLDVHCVLFEAPADGDIDQVIAILDRDPRTRSAQRNAEFEAMTRVVHLDYDDPLFNVQYGVQTQSIRRLHRVTTGTNSVVGLVDSGVDLEHPDLSGQIRQQTFIDNVRLDDQRHGTAVAGIIAARPGNGEGMVGLAPTATVRAYTACRAHGPRTLCRSFDLAKAIEHAINDGVHVLNISLAGPPDPLLADLLQVAATKHNMIIIAAANSEDHTRNFPAQLDFVHAAREDLPHWFARPAQMSTQAGGGYRVFFGSSVASAGISGITALLRSLYPPQDTHNMLRSLLQEECDGDSLQPTLRDGLHRADLCE